MTILLLRSAFTRQTSRFPQIQRRLQSSPRKTEEAVPVPSTVAPLPLWQRLGPLTTAARAYARAQSKRPYRTQVATAVVIYIAADLSAQYVSDNEYDPARTLRNAAIGGLAAIPNYKCAQALLSGETISGTIERVKDTVPTSIMNSCKLWPMVTAFSFTFLPIDWRPLFHGVVAVGWQTYLSFLNRQAEMKERLRHAEEKHVEVRKEKMGFAVAQAA
ncbi:hypothetical protein ACHAPQ_007476 [Fusarium lateritium]